MYLKIFSAKFCCSCIVLFSIITSTPSTPSFIKSIFRLGCCPFPIQWGWQHQAMPNTASPSISVLWVNLSQATYNDVSLDTFRPCLSSCPSGAGKRNVCDRFDTGCGPPNLSLIWSDIVFCHANFFFNYQWPVILAALSNLQLQIYYPQQYAWLNQNHFDGLITPLRLINIYSENGQLSFQYWAVIRTNADLLLFKSFKTRYTWIQIPWVVFPINPTPSVW